LDQPRADSIRSRADDALTELPEESPMIALRREVGQDGEEKQTDSLWINKSNVSPNWLQYGQFQTNELRFDSEPAAIDLTGIST
jgi:hypothetical protein